MIPHRLAPLPLSLLLSLSLPAAPAAAQVSGDSTTAAAESAQPTVSELDKVIVSGYADRQLLLDAVAETGSRLGLTARETPAIVDILSQRQLQEWGVRTNVEALNRAPGVTSSLPATSPGVPTMRGFSGGAVGLLYDGTRVATPGVFSRSTDSWLYDRIEILKGPAGVLYGEGALAGAINLVPKRPRFGARHLSGLLAYRSFDSYRIAADANLPVSDALAIRAVASHGRSNGYVDDNASRFSAASISLAARPSERLSLQLALDHSRDDYDVADYGAPLVPRALARDPTGVVRTPDDHVIDAALRDTNFNVTDGVLDSDTTWVRSRLDYQWGESLTFSNELNRYRSDRNFINAEMFDYQPATGLIARSTGIITHDIDYWIERAALSGDRQWGGLRNRFVVGAEFSGMEFRTRRYFGTTSAVDPYAPVRGLFPGGSGAPLPAPNSWATVKVVSVFAEDAINLTPSWLLTAGLRHDRIDFDRTLLGSGGSTRIRRDYAANSWRVGTVYDLRPKTQLFAQYSAAVAPVGNFLLLSLANARFDLTTGASVEAGIKSSFWDDRIDATLAAYHIRQDDIVTRDPVNPTLSVQGGRQSSRGVELSLSAALTERLRVDANYTALDAKFDTLREAGGISRAGNTPPRVPETIGNLFVSYRLPGLPLTIGAGARHAGRFFTDNANSIVVDGYTVFDASIGWQLPFGELALHGRNLTDELYADYSDVSPRQFQIAAPRSFDLTLTTRF